MNIGNSHPGFNTFIGHINYAPWPQCWLWKGVKKGGGYGQFNRGVAGVIGAHRFMYEQMKGPIPKGMQVNHTCDVPLCVNPLHLVLGTPRDNIMDAVRKGHHANAKKSRCPRGHVYDRIEVYGEKVHRCCLQCNATNARIRRQRG